MGVKVVIPTPLRQYTGRMDSVMAEGQTVEEVLRNLTAQYGDLRKHLYGDDGKLRSFVNIYRNDEDIRYLERERTPVKETDVLSIVPSIAGGNQSRDREGAGKQVGGSGAERNLESGIAEFRNLESGIWNPELPLGKERAWRVRQGYSKKRSGYRMRKCCATAATSSCRKSAWTAS